MDDHGFSYSSYTTTTTTSAAAPELLFLGSRVLDESYSPLPSVYLAFLVIWAAAGLSWALNTWRRRHFQMSKLQWVLASVPLIKVLQQGLYLSFWYSCINFQICSLWISFGVYVTGILFQTASFVSFLLISHGYCIMYEHLSVPEQRRTAVLGCVLYLTLIGHKAAVPYFTVFLLLNYAISFVEIFRHISQNLSVLHEQLNFIEDEDVHTMHDALHKKYSMFKKFQGAMQIIVVFEILVYMNVDETPDNYWFRSLVREWVQFCIVLYIGWNFRTQSASPRFSVMPPLKSNWEMTLPPIYSIEMDAADFEDFASQKWQVGVPTSFLSSLPGKSMDSLLVIVQHPHATGRASPETVRNPRVSAADAATTANWCQNDKDQI